jgi:FAD/FMN-containing dehydrogenase/Fe-S oxidoreductase
MNISELEKSLRQHVEGDIHFDAIHRKVYSVDASIYEVEPIGIVLPYHKQALIQAIRIADKFHVPVIARGAATGITGGCIGKALIIDTSKYLNHILDINYESEFAICEPGVVQDRLNEALSSKNYRLGPDTSTGNRATLGGMLGNNASGSRSLLYGCMADHVTEVELLLANGELLRFGKLDEELWSKKRLQQDTEGNIYRELYRIRTEYHDEIAAHFPKIPKRVSGYSLDILLSEGPINFAKLIAGSEGTLGIATEIKVRICKKPGITGLCVIHLHDMLEGMRHIEEMLAHHPIALEMIDNKIIEAGKRSPAMRNKLGWLIDEPDAVFVAEFAGKDLEDVQGKLSHFEKDIKARNIGYASICITDPIVMSQLWEVRKSGLGLLLSRRTYSRAIAFLEDITIPPKELADFMEKFKNYLKSKGKEAGIYGHVGSGCMHVRPYIDLRQTDDVHLMEQMMIDISSLLLEHGGALSGEHGDGFVRTWLNEKMFGKKLYQAFLDLKHAFDPDNQMNPHKIVNGRPFLENLRLSPETKQQKINTFMDFSREGGFELAADLCNGNGMCRKSEKVMCPSFQASGDEFHTTRARAQTLRSFINGKMPMHDFTSHGVYEVLDLCLECKGCKTECPSEVDMAKMKSEFLYHYQKAHGTSLRTILFANIGKLNQLASSFASLFNKIVGHQFSKTIMGWMGVAPEREFPKLSSETFSKWFSKQNQPMKKKFVVLFNDTFNEFNTSEIGQSAVKVLENLGYHVIVPKWTCCGRPALSKGRLEQAQAQAKIVVESLAPYAYKCLPIVGLEPSCLLTIKDDFQALLPNNADVKAVSDACITFDEFLAKHIVDGKLPFDMKIEPRQVKLHGHCHQKALVGTKFTLDVLKTIPGYEVSEIDSGCCGMAGSFGYEKEHYAFSMKIGQLKLFPAIEASEKDTLIVADGFSCRCQIEHGTQRKSYHLAEVVAQALN